MKNPMYQLPTIEFIGGESISLVWNLWAVSPTATINQGSPFDANGCTVTFSLVNFTDKSDIPLISKACTISEGESGTMSVATVFLSSSDTVNMEGKYIYQLTIKNQEGETEIPGQGIIFINRNIDRNLVSGITTLRRRLN